MIRRRTIKLIVVRFFIVSRIVLLAMLSGFSARAQYHRYDDVPAGADCILQSYRSPDLSPGIYDAIHQDTVSSADGGRGYFYGGMVHDRVNGRTLVQFVCWPARGGFAPYSQQVPTFAGTNMTWWPQIGEGSSCAIKGYWPLFQSNLWYRFAVRCWQPVEGAPHLGFQGMWMKEPVTGNWYHLGTFMYPFALTGVNGMSGWQENFTGYAGKYTVDHAGGYYHKNGIWTRANQISYTTGKPHACASVIETNTATRSVVAGPQSSNNYPVTLTLANQPLRPVFDPIIVSRATAHVVNSQLLVQWELPLSSSPQLDYRLEVFTNSACAGVPVVAVSGREPEVRHALLDIAGVPTPYVRLTIADIFFNTNAPILLTPSKVPLCAAADFAGVASGLAYEYYEAAAGDWSALPDLAALSPVKRGAVAVPEPTPRRRRINYAFNYHGYFTAPRDGLYAFTLHSGDGSRLLIDGEPVITFDGLHDSSQSKSGGIALAAGAHRFKLQFFKGAANAAHLDAYTDGLGLAYEGPGIALTDVPAAAFTRVPDADEPSIALASPSDGELLPALAPGLSASVAAKGNKIDNVRFVLTDFYSYYPRPARGADYFFGSAAAEPFSFNSMVWAAPSNLLRARLTYNGTNTIDSAPVRVGTTNGNLGAWRWLPLEIHNYPPGAAVQDGKLILLGDGFNMLGQSVTGDCTLVAHLARITPDAASPEGVRPDPSWRAGIILRAGTNTTIGEPLGKTGTPFAALFGTVGGGVYFQEVTMRKGNGDANRWSANLGGTNRWLKLERCASRFTSSVSQDGKKWTIVHVTNLTGFSEKIFAGVFTHAVQSLNPNIHSATFDSCNLVTTNPGSFPTSPKSSSTQSGQIGKDDLLGTAK